MDSLEHLKEQERIVLLNILHNFEGKKCLFFEKSLHVMLSVILNDDDINKEHIENIFFVHKVNDINVNAINNISNVLFFLRPYFYEIKNIFEIIDKIEKSKSTKRKNNYVFIFVPYMSYLCKQEILKYNVLDIPLKIILFPLYFFPLYNDVYSLEIKNLFKEYYVDNDFSNLIFCSFSLMFLQFLFNGVFKNIKSIGNLAQFSSEQLIQLRKEIMASNFNIQSPNDFQDDFYDILTNIQNFQDLKNFKNANDTTVVPLKYALHKIFISEKKKKKKKNNKIKNNNKNKPTIFASEEGNEYFSCLTKEEPNSCIIIDRRVDMITPFCTPFTYEGLIDHFFGIDNLQIEIPRYIIFNEENKHVKYDMMENKDKKECNNNMINNNNMNNMNNYDNSYGNNNNNIINKTMKVRVKLKSSVDVLYNDIKDLSQNEIGSFLHKKASDIQKTYKEKDSLKDIEEINQYMRIFKEKHYEHNSLSTHVNIASFILNNIKKEYNFNKLKLEDEIIQLEINTNKNILLSIVKQIQLLIYTNDDIYEVYRLLCLFSILTNGINQNYINELKKDIIEQYGIKELTRLNKLYTCNILKFNNKQKFLWTQLKNNFHLLSNDENDISYVCNGYAPLSVRLIEYMAAFKNNLQVFPEIFNLLNGPTLDIIQNPIGYETLPIQNKTKNNHINLNNTKKKKKNVLLFYIGGISYAEIASIRALNKKNQHYNYLIFTTEIVSSKKFLQSME
ncbi:hypothetical protein PFMALIP_02653 [Plasmodium falciparum MaliPS096_E11]|uniref:Vacuolar protein sorting-associated protein 33 n=1 Tax=Plasmodium falciparum MaliPS096_E11 TaxID=1036727 RepID=A0A024WQ42_PLAFA|nr:hypothetical protein PFMALIP_02653 [Plasmodium falciparum MaliPS096_E11]